MLPNKRGLVAAVAATDYRMVESLAIDNFRCFQHLGLHGLKAVSVNLIGSPENTREVRVHYRPDDTLTLPLDTGALDSTVVIPITFEWTDSIGKKSIAQPTITDKGFSMGAVGHALRAAFFNSISLYDGPAEAAAQFSELSQRNQSDRVVAALSNVFPFIGNMSVEVSGGIPMLYCSTPHLSVKEPVALASAGTTKLLNIMLGIASQPKGIVLIDEIENGFYFNTMPKVWETILAFCSEFDVQVFASTHSMECLRSVLGQLKGNEGSFCLLRTEKLDGVNEIKQFDGTHFEAALEEGFEIR